MQTVPLTTIEENKYVLYDIQVLYIVQYARHTYISGLAIPRSRAQSRYALQAINILSVPPEVILVEILK